MIYQPAPPDHEPHKVFLHRGEFVDQSRGGRVVPFKVYYPSAHHFGALPVVIWSHGLGGTRDGAAFLSRYIASHGYVVVNIQHAGTDSIIWEGKPGHPWDIIKSAKITREDTVNRYYDVPFLLDCLPAFVRAEPEIGAFMNLEKIGMCGHSFGALTTQIMAGQPFTGIDGLPKRMPERRFVAGILYSFVPVRPLADLVDPAKLYGGFEMPLFFMTGTDDENPITGQGYEFRMPVYEQAGCSEKALLVLEEGDHMVFAGSRGKLAAHPKRHIHEDIIKVASLAWWEAHLKGNRAAADWLSGAGFQTWLGKEGRYEYERKSAPGTEARSAMKPDIL